MMIKYLPSLIALGLYSGTLFAQNVGIDEAAPSAKLDIVQTAAVDLLELNMTGTAGNAIQLNNLNTGNASSALWVVNQAVGRGLNISMVNAVSTASAIAVSQDGEGFGANILMRNAGSSAPGVSVTNDGLGNCIEIVNNNEGWGVLHINNSASGGLGSYNLMNTAGSWGTYIDLNTQNSVGVQVVNVDDMTAPTVAADGWGFRATMNSATSVTAGSVFGGLFAGTQHGESHGILVTHNGTTGRGIEVNLNGTTNDDANYFGVSNGEGPVFNGQNQNNTIAGAAISVGDFSYTGSDVDDHIGVAGASTPAAGWGIGVEGTGNFYGVYADGDLGASGTKTFLIDHPMDPANKFLRHYSVESDEVINMYRGMITLDASGKATVSMPSYFEAVNKDFSYQLTSVGTAQQAHVSQEIANNTFQITGAPNTKVSWMVLAHRNDPYIQQNPNKLIVELPKTGSRKGKYVRPELYNQPASLRMFNPRYSVKQAAKAPEAVLPLSKVEAKKELETSQENPNKVTK